MWTPSLKGQASWGEAGGPRRGHLAQLWARALVINAGPFLSPPEPPGWGSAHRVGVAKREPGTETQLRAPALCPRSHDTGSRESYTK